MEVTEHAPEKARVVILGGDSVEVIREKLIAAGSEPEKADTAAVIMRRQLNESMRYAKLGAVGLAPVLPRPLVAPVRACAKCQERIAVATNSKGDRVCLKCLRSAFTVVGTRVRCRRNDPCTCGSGKKYKKCCAAPKAGVVNK